MLFCHLPLLFKINFFQNISEWANSLDTDQARQNVGPDLCPNCLQKLSADKTSSHQNHLFRKNLRAANSLDKDQARQNVRPDLCPNCLQKLSADNISSLGVSGVKTRVN